MDHLAVLSELESLGTEQNRKIYKRHGAKGELYGVSFANLEKLKKTLKKNQLSAQQQLDIAQKLWESGNYDARIFATMIADPTLVSESTLEKWLAELDSYGIAYQFATLASQTKFAKEKMPIWIGSDSEWIGCAGWRIIAYLTMETGDLADEFFEKYLQIIEKDIHTQKNYVKDTMNDTLIAIGVRSPNLQEKALKVAAKIGKVVVDHGETSCKTPDAAEYINKTVAYREKKNSQPKKKASKAK